MSRRLHVLSAAVLLLALGCGSRGEEMADVRLGLDGQALPRWLSERINQLEREPVANPPARVLRYEYKWQTVYYFPPSCCDVPSELFDAAGQRLCSPDGGFTGRGDGRCPDFSDVRTGETLVWADERSDPPPGGG